MSSFFSLPVKAITCTADGDSWFRVEERLAYNQETNKFNLVFLSGYFTPGRCCFLLPSGLILRRAFGASSLREEEQNVWERARGENTPPWSLRYHAPPPVLANEEKWHRNNTQLNQSLQHLTSKSGLWFKMITVNYLLYFSQSLAANDNYNLTAYWENKECKDLTKIFPSSLTV